MSVMTANVLIKQCKLGVFTDSLGDNERTALLKALGNSEWSAAALVKVLKQYGFPVGTTTVKTHRSGDCVCYL